MNTACARQGETRHVVCGRMKWMLCHSEGHEGRVMEPDQAQDKPG